MGIPRAGNLATAPPSGDLGAAAVDVRRGKDRAAQLAALLRSCPGQEEAGGLAEEVLASLSRALASFDSYAAAGPCRGPPAVEERTAGPSEPLEGSEDRRKVQAAGERRRGQTRSRRSQPYGCRKVVARQLEDGHTWRKYGQKEIHGFKYPRCYFRCSHKYDQGCQAVRQVQKSEEDPSALLITYLGDHTCKEAAALLHPAAAEPFVISFGPPTPMGGGQRGPPSTISRMMPETWDGPVSGPRSPRDSAGSSSPTYLMLPELTPLGSSVPLPGRMSSTDNLDTAPSWFADADDSVESLRFEGMLGLDHYDFDFVSP